MRLADSEIFSSITYFLSMSRAASLSVKRLFSVVVEWFTVVATEEGSDGSFTGGHTWKVIAGSEGRFSSGRTFRCSSWSGSVASVAVISDFSSSLSS